MNRRKFVRNTLAAALAAGVSKLSIGDSHAQYFSHLKKEAGRWWLIRPDGEKYFSLGLNHIDPATLRYAENLHIWREKNGNSMERWLKDSVAPNLKEWGFNCLGWNQEVTSRGIYESPPLSPLYLRRISMVGDALLSSTSVCRFSSMGSGS